MKRFQKFIPMAFLALGMVGALSSFTMRPESKKAINIQGYLRVNPLGTQCNASVMCADDFGPICTVGSTQVWGKDAAGNCVVELKRNHQ